MEMSMTAEGDTRPAVVFMGSDAIAVPALEYLVGEGAALVRLVGVVSQPDRPHGRGQRLQPNPVAAWARDRGLALLQPEKPGEPEYAWLREHGVALVLVMAYGHILRQALLDLPRLGVLNLHASVLPAYRGASPVEGAVAMGETETGVTLMRVVPALDAGPMLDVERVRVGPQDTAALVRERLAQACVPLLGRGLPRVVAGTAVFEDQDASRVTYTRKLTKTDGALDFSASAAELANRIRALDTWPGCFFTLGETVVKVSRAEAESLGGEAGAPGMVLGADAGGLLVGTGSGTLRIGALQRPGGKMLPASDFLRGFPIAAGTMLGGGVMPRLVSPQPFPRTAKKVP